MEQIIKYRWYAVMLGYIFPGLGLIYENKLYAGIVVMVTSISGIATGIILLISNSANNLDGLLLFVGGVLVWLISLVASYRFGTMDNKTKNSVFFPLLVNFIFPGIGSILSRAFLSGIIILIFYRIIIRVIVLPHLPWVFDHIFKASLAFLSIPQHLRRGILREKIILGVTLLLISTIMRTGFFRIFTTNYVGITSGAGSSMEPSIKEGDIILIDRKAINNLRRGDIVSFKQREINQEEILCKRLIAFGGETISISKGNIIINGKAISNPPFNVLFFEADSNSTLSKMDTPFVVPINTVIVLGDNTKESDDSRAFGAIRQEDIIGVNYKIIWPTNRFALLRN